MEAAALSRIGLAGLAVMGQNLALNVAEKGFPIFVYNRTALKVDETLDRAHREGQLPLTGHYTADHMEPGDTIIDGGNEWYENTERRILEVGNKGLLYLGMGVSGGEEGARNGPSLMPDSSFQQ